MGLVDLHSHILAGLDDGARGKAQSIQMARAAQRGGVSDIVATPHFDLDSGTLSPASVLEAVEGMNLALQDEGIAVKVHPGAEVRMSAALARPGGLPFPLEELTICRGGTYLLVDLPAAVYPLPSDEAFFRLLLAGVTPVLAHPERNRLAREDPGRLASLRERGVLLQVNAGSLLGSYGRRIKRVAWRLLEEGLAHLVASDAHHPGNGSLDLAGVRGLIASQLGDEAADLLLLHNPRRVLEGEPVPQAERPARKGKRSHGGQRLPRSESY
jgi:protein-tyrosine phosphatase